MLEASFDIVQDASLIDQSFLEAETLLVLCRVIKMLAPVEETSFNLPPITLRSPLWFVVSMKSHRSTCLFLYVSDNETNVCSLISEVVPLPALRCSS